MSGRRGRTRTLALLALLLLPAAALANPAPHSRAFWQEIVRHDYAVPAGESPMALVRELSGYFGSPDPELRDAFAAILIEQWIDEKKLLTPAELRELLPIWTANLKLGLGESGTDSVLRRSYSALALSNLAAFDAGTPFLTRAEFAGLLNATLDYLDHEKDVRGYDPRKGWLHSAAHTADILTALGRSPYLKPADPARILNAIARKMDNPGGVFTYGEDERLAQAVLVLVRRDDFDTAAFTAMTDGFLAEAKPLWQGPLDLRRFAAVENSKHLLASLYTQLAMVKPFPALAPIQTKILACLAAMSG
jgi:hypothetical protein